MSGRGCRVRAQVEGARRATRNGKEQGRGGVLLLNFKGRANAKNEHCEKANSACLPCAESTTATNNFKQSAVAWRSGGTAAVESRGPLQRGEASVNRPSGDPPAVVKLTSVLLVFDILLPLEMLSIVFLKTWRLR